MSSLLEAIFSFFTEIIYFNMYFFRLFFNYAALQQALTTLLDESLFTLLFCYHLLSSLPGLSVFSTWAESFYLAYGTSYTLLFTLKITACLSFLILIRGGVPRYRYDFLTKLGWVKFLGYTLVIFIMALVSCWPW